MPNLIKTTLELGGASKPCPKAWCWVALKNTGMAKKSKHPSYVIKFKMGKLKKKLYLCEDPKWWRLFFIEKLFEDMNQCDQIGLNFASWATLGYFLQFQHMVFFGYFKVSKVGLV